MQEPKIKVVVRKRPLLRKEQTRGQVDVVDVRHNNTVVVREQKIKVDLTKYIDEQFFTFDHAFGQTSTNQQLYQACVRPLIDSAFKGAKISVFAYGQTGSGKTFTMNGDHGMNVPGLYALSGRDLFHLKELPQNQHLALHISFFQIYCGKLFDLLNDRAQLQARQDAKSNVHIVGLEERRVQSAQELMDLLQLGSHVRVTSSNSQNADSSRSHAVLQISLKQKRNVFGKISFIDLAGCERGSDTDGSSKQTRIDGAEINKSLLALKQCIRALDQGKTHTPFRGSKLTMVLKDSFVGFCKTVMIGNISPSASSCEYTLNTLRYADRVKQLKKGGQQQAISKEDQLARELMLPRMQANTKRVSMPQQDQEQPRPPSIRMKMITEQQHRSIPPLFPKPHLTPVPVREPPHKLVDRQIPSEIPKRPREFSRGELKGQSVSRNNHLKRKSDCQNLASYKDKQNNNALNSHRALLDQPKLYELNLQQLNNRNSDMIDNLFQQENDLIECHRQYLKGVVGLVRKKTALLDQFSECGLEIKDYIGQLQDLIESQGSLLGGLKMKLQDLKRQQRAQAQVQAQMLRAGMHEPSLLQQMQMEY